MDRLIVERKLDSLQRCIQRVTSRRPPSVEALEADIDRLAEAGILDAELSLRMRKAVGFRNIAVHAYDTIDWKIVHAIATDRLQDFKAFGRTVAAKLDAKK